ncbi:MAG TPA: DUF2117 domain-containing protein [Methanoregulaceae archaeon]|nr:MAG: DUF2117 domain-containing protein [Methanolinea sp.]HON82278.1 DUF2117 domain-containing protein [Methanoregulaceae archaeon]HPD09842.1 DUF2117 domain-containing protein [Methanoregulaceae archaeon]HRT14967.1 DUF2117 domain-containing protein [Methanoregulaceae archaeon]HRU30418.1 DUF2117 domain-containing protein [Methanoregulaceae archaeon]
MHRQLILVIHGPEPFDSGEAAFLIEQLAPSRIIVAGVMARTAAEESGIPCELAGLPPSMVIRDLPLETVLANHGKTPDSGRIFGEIVASRLAPRGILHLEASSRTLFLWNREPDTLAQETAERTGYMIEEVRTPPLGDTSQRIIRGCLPGEAVFVNGIVIGQATGPEVVIRKEGRSIIPVSGMHAKDHGLEKLADQPFIDLSRVWCKSGLVRTALPRAGEPRTGPGRVLFIDHCGHRLYDVITPETRGIVCVGDDTTAVCGHIAAHLGIPVLGIVDGDADGIVPSSFAPGTVIARAVRERDDDIGREIQGMIPGKMVAWDDVVENLIGYLGERVEIIRSGR